MISYLCVEKMKAMVQIRNFQETFKKEDIKLAMDVTSTYNCGISRIALCAPNQVYRIGNHSVRINEKEGACSYKAVTLKLEYAIQVWNAVAIISTRNPKILPYYWSLNWEENGTPFRELRYSTYFQEVITPEELANMFWHLLQEVADSGIIKVHERFSHTKKSSENPFYSIEYKIVLDDTNARNILDRVTNVYEYDFDTTPRSYSWNEIKDMFVELTLDQLRLTMPEKMHNFKKEDELLFYACDNLDYKLAKYAIEQGANVNALDKSGESALQKALSYFPDHGMKYSENYTEEKKAAIKKENYVKCLAVVDLLLDNGAYIDLFGYDGMQPLLTAYYANSIDMMKHLLQRGANPNFNSFLTDLYSEYNWNIKCSILDVLWGYDDDEEEERVNMEIEKLLESYGAKLYEEGYDPRKE